VDASALVKATRDEAGRDAFLAWLRQARQANLDLLAPHLLRYELGNFLARQPSLDAAGRQQVLDDLLLGFRFADGDGSFAYAPPLTFYDASYLALAAATGSTLVSYDSALLAAARKAKIRTFSPR
jgi:predicted nucleic acid-binding protein